MPDSDTGPWKVTAKDIVNGKINFTTARKTTQVAYEQKLTNKSRPKVDDILLTKDGSLGRLAIVKNENLCVNQSVAVLRVNNKILPEYLYYLLSSPKYQSQMLGEADGTVIKHIYITRVAKMEVDIPSFGSMNLKEAKEWLNQQSLELEARIKNIEKNSSLDSEQLAFIAINMRNSFINSARNAVYDKRVFASLELDQSLWDYKYLESKYAKEGYSGEALNRKIIADSSDKKMLDDAMTLRHFDGIEDDLLYQLAQDMETNGAREMRSTVEQGGCFPAGTRVMTDKGLVSIQDIKTGDMVLSKPENGEGEICYKPVVRTVSYDNKEIWELSYFEISADTDISKLTRIKLLQISRKGKMFSTMATPNHPFWVKGVGWTRLDELKNGQIIETNDPKILALVFMVNPLRKTSKPNVAGSYHPRNLFDADKKGFEIEDVEYFDLFEYSDLGLCEVLGENSSSPFMVDNHEIHVLKENFTLKVYNFEVADHHTYFITKRGLWVHNTNCAEATSDAAPKDLVTRSGNEISKKDTLGHDINVYANKASVYEAFNGIQNGEGGIAIVKRAIGNDTGKNGNVLPSIEFDRGAPNALFDKGVGNNEHYEYILIGEHPNYRNADGTVNNKFYNYVKFEGYKLSLKSKHVFFSELV